MLTGSSFECILQEALSEKCRSLQKCTTAFRFYSQQWLRYLEEYHADRWLNNPQLDVIAIGTSKRNPQRLSLLKLLPKSEEEVLLESLFPE